VAEIRKARGRAAHGCLESGRRHQLITEDENLDRVS
jgi:hypothetical protein